MSDDADRKPPQPEELAEALRGSSIEEVLRIQDQLARFLRERYEKPVSVLFSDIAGSTAYFEKYGDAEGRRMIQRHNDLLIPVIQKRGGRVVKTIGDALMATFPSANLAVDAAIAMQQAVAESNARISHIEERFDIRIGVNFGTAIVNDKDGDVYGDMVNVAARVQSEAGKGQVLVSDVVREYLSPAVPLKAAGTFRLKGKSQEFQLFEVQWRELSRPEVELERPNLGARYAVLELLGSGGMASVWRARDEKLGRDVAVKVLHGHMQTSWSTRERFHREAVVAASLAHENIVQVYDYASQEAPQSFIAMELVEGEQLRNFLQRTGPLPAVVTLLIAHEIARGLAFAHARQIIHRDLKPENVLVSRTGAVKIADFGIAGVGEMVRLTHAGAQVGTPAYLSPEQVQGETASTRSDVFAMGVMLYEMATGRGPFEAETSAATMYRIVEGAYIPPEQFPNAEPDLAALIRRCLSRDPEERPSNAAALSSELSALLQQREVGDPRTQLARYLIGGDLPRTRAVAPSTQEAIASLPKRSRRVYAVAGLAALVAVVAGVTFAFTRDRKPTARPVPVPVVRLPGVGKAVTVSTTPSSVEPASAKQPAAVQPEPVEGPPSTPHPSQPAPKVVRATAKTRTRPAKLENGTLKLVVSGGWADIRIDGVKVGRYPMQRTLTVVEGKHVLELTGNPARKPYRATLEIEPGKALDHSAELQPISP